MGQMQCGAILFQRRKLGIKKTSWFSGTYQISVVGGVGVKLFPQSLLDFSASNIK